MVIDWTHNALRSVAERMLIAARTAPKGKGIDNLAMAILERDDIVRVAGEMRRIGAEGHGGFLRDAENLLDHAEFAVLIGTKIDRIGLKYCGLCGFADCDANRKAGAVCAFNPGDLGIAVGSAVSVAMDARVDNRIMYSIGMAAVNLKLLGDEIKIVMGIPITATGKNPFFDRKPPK